jgi:phage terminase Nu1 subunit (DNA packaging protein)
MLDFDSKQVAQWIRSNAYKSKDEDLVNELADLIEEDL